MGLPTISWTNVLPNLNARGPKNKPINNSVRKGDSSIMYVGENILAAAAEAVIDENWCLLDNQLTCSTFVNGNYLSNKRDAPIGKYLRVHCNAYVTHITNSGDHHRYSNPVWYNHKGTEYIVSLRLSQKIHPVTYNIRYGNQIGIHIPQRPTLNMTKAGLFYHDMRHLLKNREFHIMVNGSHSPIPQVQYKKKRYTSHNIRRADRARQIQHITGHPINQILNAVDNNILQNHPILWEDVRMADDIYGPSIPHLNGKTLLRKIQQVDPIKITSVPKTILDK